MNVTTDDTLMILGRQPALGLAELESLYGYSNVQPIGANTALVKLMPCAVDFSRLGGSVKLCKILATLPTTNWGEIIKFLANAAPAQAGKMPAGKMHLGLSALGFKISPAKINAGGLTIKKAIAVSGRSVRLVPNKANELNAASVIHNKLLTVNGWELVIIRDGARAIIAQTLFVQDIASYALRDRGRPKRDARVGMLPPKLAQIIINLASGLDEMSDITIGEDSKVCLSDSENTELKLNRAKKTVLDPFCGTGVILQEAMLMGYSVTGSDIEPRMGDYTIANLDWLRSQFPETPNAGLGWQLGDATNMTWETSRFIEKNGEVIDAQRVPAIINFIASETYLGRPFTSPPTPEILAKTISECNLIIKKFLANIHGQLTSGTRLCLAVPAWRLPDQRVALEKGRPSARNDNEHGGKVFSSDEARANPQFKHLPVVDQISDLGYNRLGFKHASKQDLIYFRPDQIVARELLVLTRK